MIAAKSEDALGQELANLARGNRERMLRLSLEQTHIFVREAFRQHQVVWLLWIEDDRVVINCAKGVNLLSFGAVMTTALPVPDHATAMALAERWGDGKLFFVRQVPETLQ